VVWPAAFPREATHDALLRALPRPAFHPGADLPVLTVEIDRNALAALGPWPWPRSIVAALVERIAEGGAAALALDLLLEGPDRGSPALLARRLAAALGGDPALAALADTLPDHDAALARALGRLPVALGFVLAPESSAPPPVRQGWAVLGDPAGLPAAPGAVGPLPALADAAAGLGAISLTGAPVRAVPLAVAVAGEVRAGLALEAVRLALGAPTPVLRAATAEVALGAALLGAGPALRLHPARAAPPAVTALALLRGEVPAERIAGRIVLLGGVAPELGALRETPFAALVPSLRIQAEAVAQILQGWLPRVPGWAGPAEAAAALAFGLAGAAAAALLPPLGAAGAVLLLAALPPALAAVALARGDAAARSVPALAALALSAGVAGLAAFAALRRARARLVARFAQHLAPEVVARIAAAPGTLRIAGERRRMSFVFTDIEGFTALAERLPPERVVALLDAYLAEAVEIAVAHGGAIDKVVGDALHVMFGAPLAQPDHARRALDCAVALAGFGTRFMAREPGFGRTRVGVATGEAVIGDVGGGRKLDYTAHGTPVNLAARLEAANKLLGTAVLADAATAADSPARPMRRAALLGLRGLAGPVEAFAPWQGTAAGLAAWRAVEAALDAGMREPRSRRSWRWSRTMRSPASTWRAAGRAGGWRPAERPAARSAGVRGFRPIRGRDRDLQGRSAPQQLRKLGHRHGRADDAALRLSAALRLQQAALLLRLDAGRADRDAVPGAQANHRPRQLDPVVPPAEFGDQQRRQARAVEGQRAHRRRRQRGATEPVQHDPDAAPAQPVQRADQQAGHRREIGFAHQQLQPLRRQAGLGQRRRDALDQPGVEELRRGQPDRQAQIPRAAGGLGAGTAQQQAAERLLQAERGGERRQHLRRDQAVHRVAPPQARLHTADPARGQVGDGLVADLEILARAGGEREPQVEFEQAVHLRPRRHLRREDGGAAARATAGASLSGPHRQPGLGQRILGGRGGGDRRDADRRRDDDAEALDIEGARDRRDQALRQTCRQLDHRLGRQLRGLGPGTVAQVAGQRRHQGEFISAEPRQHDAAAVAPHLAQQPPGGGADQRIAGARPERLVHAAQAAEVQVQHRGRATRGGCVAQHPRQVLVERQAVRQAGQRIVPRQVVDASLRRALAAGILEGREPAAIGQRPADHQHAALRRHLLDEGAGLAAHHQRQQPVQDARGAVRLRQAHGAAQGGERDAGPQRFQRQPDQLRAAAHWRASGGHAGRRSSTPATCCRAWRGRRRRAPRGRCGAAPPPPRRRRAGGRSRPRRARRPRPPRPGSARGGGRARRAPARRAPAAGRWRRAPPAPASGRRSRRRASPRPRRTAACGRRRTARRPGRATGARPAAHPPAARPGPCHRHPAAAARPPGRATRPAGVPGAAAPQE
jgi:adenylate cyclase